jgi:YidC/Oxa1 family membrane protein insertase
MNFWNLLVLNPMVNLLLWIYDIINNFGISIILFTILIRMLTYPLTVQQMKATSAMTELQKSKEWLEIQKKNKGDKQKIQQEQAKFMQEKGISPFSSCLPTLIQFPVIIGLYQAIIRALATIPLQMVDLSSHIYPFVNAAGFLPINNKFLWMDLSQPERLYIPGLAVGIPVLAVLVVISTFLQSRVMTPPSQPGEQSAQMAQSMNTVMPLMMGWLALTFASGLSLYFLTSNLVSIAQYAAMGKVDWRNLIPTKKPAQIK